MFWTDRRSSRYYRYNKGYTTNLNTKRNTWIFMVLITFVVLQYLIAKIKLHNKPSCTTYWSKMFKQKTTTKQLLTILHIAIAYSLIFDCTRFRIGKKKHLINNSNTKHNKNRFA